MCVQKLHQNVSSKVLRVQWLLVHYQLSGWCMFFSSGKMNRLILERAKTRTLRLNWNTHAKITATRYICCIELMLKQFCHLRHLVFFLYFSHLYLPHHLLACPFMQFILFDAEFFQHTTKHVTLAFVLLRRKICEFMTRSRVVKFQRNSTAMNWIH